MTARISHTAVDARDAYAQSVWWAEVLGWHEDPEDPNEPGHTECLIFSADGRQRVLFIEVGDPKAVKNRIHFDFTPDDQRAEVERLVVLGARHVDIGQGNESWVVLADPEGNEFCVLAAEG